MGGCGLAYEYTFSRIASDLLGNSVQQWAVVIAIMMFCMGMGAEIQRFIPTKRVVSSMLGSQLLLALLGGFGPLFMHLRTPEKNDYCREPARSDERLHSRTASGTLFDSKSAEEPRKGIK